MSGICVERSQFSGDGNRMMLPCHHQGGGQEQPRAAHQPFASKKRLSSVPSEANRNIIIAALL